MDMQTENGTQAEIGENERIMLELVGVSKQFGSGKRLVTAVRDVSLRLRENEVYALIGESGSGKSTMAEMIAGLQKPTSGTIRWLAAAEQEANGRSRVQLVFQNPDRSLNPYWKVEELVAEPLLLRRVDRATARKRVEELLERVRLPRALLDRRPGECSCGQKQRIAIARALAVSPALLIADEITSALDPKTEADILALLASLKAERRMSILYITHRLETVQGFADRLAVMKDGAIVEAGEAEEICTRPRSAYTRALLAAGLFA
ncbi:ABC transporter ATP-binding protein [Brevibacillus marinus]|uniref:ABC transporter ATP-binding protein n=1 Tax=Brevibacillus marinus TaxID=2496837 RepID=UPI001F49EDB5|nr:ABC transporter ATP-binding protein [Brevibacillus marinus]